MRPTSAFRRLVFRQFVSRRDHLMPAILAVVLLAMSWAAVGPALADDTGAATTRVLFRELEEATVSADQPYFLVASQELLCEGEESNEVCKYELRYNHALPGEQLNVLPDEQLNVHLINQLQGLSVAILEKLDPKVVGSNDDDDTKVMISEASSVTNLHTHGLHVSPAERSDNVLLKIEAGKRNGYTIDLPATHAPGTHWYHAHLHGSTALQVQGGMAGALIVQPPPGQSLNPPGFRVQERVMVLQFGAGWELNEREDAETEGFEAMGLTRIKPNLKLLRELIDAENEEDLLEVANRLDGSGMSTLMKALKGLQLDLPPVLVNGLENPVLEIQQDVAVQRFRVINAGSRFPDYKRLWIENPAVPGESLPMYVGAIDGVNLTSLPKDAEGRYIAYTEDNPLELAPGNRADIFFIPEDAGTFSLMMEGEVGIRDAEDRSVSVASLTDEELEPKRLAFERVLLTLKVGGPDVATAMTETAGQDLGATSFLDALDRHLETLQETIPAYRDGYLRPFDDGEDFIERTIEFDVQRGQGRPFLINGRSYNELNAHGHMSGHDDYLGKEPGDGGRGPGGESPWPLRADTVEQWTISNISNRVHPFHVHVSPFWVVDIVEENEDGDLVSVKATNPYDPRLNRWQDTVTLPERGGHVVVRHRVSQFTGLYVIHCHILQHEDRGMMINVLTVPNQEADPAKFFEDVNRRNQEINDEINR